MKQAVYLQLLLAILYVVGQLHGDQDPSLPDLLGKLERETRTFLVASQVDGSVSSMLELGIIATFILA